MPVGNIGGVSIICAFPIRGWLDMGADNGVVRTSPLALSCSEIS